MKITAKNFSPYFPDNIKVMLLETLLKLFHEALDWSHEKERPGAFLSEIRVQMLCLNGLSQHCVIEVEVFDINKKLLFTKLLDPESNDCLLDNFIKNTIKSVITLNKIECENAVKILAESLDRLR